MPGDVNAAAETRQQRLDLIVHSIYTGLQSREAGRALADLAGETVALVAEVEQLRAERDAARGALSIATEHDKDLRQQIQRLQEALREIRAIETGTGWISDWHAGFQSATSIARAALTAEAQR